jgi:hypothetical protein
VIFLRNDDGTISVAGGEFDAEADFSVHLLGAAYADMLETTIRVTTREGTAVYRVTGAQELGGPSLHARLVHVGGATSLLEDARRLAEAGPYDDGGNGSYNEPSCIHCLAFPGDEHYDDCPWLAMPRIVAALEAGLSDNAHDRCTTEAFVAAHEIAELREEVRLLRQREWEPSDGIWRVERTEYGRSSTLVAPLDAPEGEALARAALQRHADAAVRAIRGVFDRETFCPTMLEHATHGGPCGVFPSADAIWRAARDAIAKELGGR